MATNMVHLGFHAKTYWKVDHLWKRNGKICIGSKVMAKTNSGVKFWPFPLYFGPFWSRKWPFQRQHFPWAPRAHPYIFGISGTRRMGLASGLIQNLTFYFPPPPPNIVFSIVKNLKVVLVSECLFYCESVKNPMKDENTPKSISVDSSHL